MTRVIEKKKSRRRSLIAAVIVILVAAALAAVALWLNRSGRLAPSGERTEVYNFASDAGTVTCGVGDGLAVASSSGLRVFDRTGMQTVGETYVASRPVLTAAGTYGAAYDIGGEQVRIFTDSGPVRTLKADGGVTAVRLNEKGWCAVCAGESGYKGAVTLYRPSGAVAYKWLSGEGYVLTAAVSRDGRYLSVLTLTDSGSRVVFLKTDRDTPVGEAVLPGELLLDIGYTEKGALYGISGDALYRLDEHKGAEEAYRYEDASLSGWSFSGGPLLALSAYRTGGACRVLDLSGQGPEELCSFEEGIISLAADRNTVAVLTSAGLSIYDRTAGELTAEYKEAASGLSVSLTEDDRAIVAERNTAAVYSLKTAG